MWDDDQKQQELEVARQLDKEDGLSYIRDEFYIPNDAVSIRAGTPNSLEITSTNDNACIYLCGNSLGLQPKGTQALVLEELQVWASQGVYGHHIHPKSRPWIDIDETVTTEMAKIVGAEPDEVAVMGTLTSNLHFLMAAFYKPDEKRYKIIIEEKAFPSDYYAIESQVKWHGLDASAALIAISPGSGRHTLTTEEILRTIEEHRDSAAMILLSGVQYYTGQLFEMEKITKYAKDCGLIVGWDLAHAAGNVMLKLHDWKVDFAAWCTYKYLNSGPGGIGAIFVHKDRSVGRRLAGWWGHDKKTRFAMENDFIAIPGAAGFQHSNPSVLATVCLLGSLNVFAKTNMESITAKSQHLTGYLEKLLTSDKEIMKHFEIITPTNPLERGAQLSLLFKNGIMQKVHQKLQLAGIIVDERKPDVIRVAPAPLYNTYEEVFKFSAKLHAVIAEVTQI